MKKAIGLGVLALIVLTVIGVVMGGEPQLVTVAGPLTAAEHEVAEGYFAVGDKVTLMVKPSDGDLYQFLARHTGEPLMVTVKVINPQELSTLSREGGESK